MDIEIFGVSEITYLAIDPPPMSFFVTCIATAALPLPEYFLENRVEYSINDFNIVLNVEKCLNINVLCK